MSDFEVPEAIICSPFGEPTHHWRLEEGTEPDKRPGRRPERGARLLGEQMHVTVKVIDDRGNELLVVKPLL
jgi:hypothetical protein